jgi:hypothetical protein
MKPAQASRRRCEAFSICFETSWEFRIGLACLCRVLAGPTLETAVARGWGGSFLPGRFTNLLGLITAFFIAVSY